MSKTTYIFKLDLNYKLEEEKTKECKGKQNSANSENFNPSSEEVKLGNSKYFGTFDVFCDQTDCHNK